MYKVSNITFRKKASTPGKLVKCFAFEISENIVAILHTHRSCQEFSHPFDCLLSGYAKTGKRFCSAFRKYNMFLSWQENRSKTLCILELIKKEILTAHDLNVVHKKFFNL